MKSPAASVLAPGTDKDPPPPPSSHLSRSLDGILFFWVAGTAALVLWGYGLSLLHAFGSKQGWLTGWLAVVIGAWLSARRIGFGSPLWRGALRELRATVRLTPALAIAAGGAIFALGTAAIVGFGSAPSNWDSLTYHLPRVAYYAQFGSLEDFGANWWPQEAHGRVSAILLGALLVPTGMSDRFYALPQFASLLVLMLTTAGLARSLGASRTAALVAGASCALAINAGMEAATAQNDLLIAAFLGAALYAGIGFIERGDLQRLFIAATAVALAVGAKASALPVLPALATVLVGVAFVAWRGGRVSRIIGRAIALGVGSAVALTLIAFPAGYTKNYRHHGDPLGDPRLRHDTLYPDVGAGTRVRLAALNAVRFASDAATLDGLPESWGGAAGNTLKRPAKMLTQWLGPDGQREGVARPPFRSNRPRQADPDNVWFGIIGPGWLFPGWLAALLFAGARGRVFAVGAVVFAIIQCSVGPYDPWRGRQWIYVLPLVAPLTAWLVDRRARSVQWGITAVLAVAAISASLAGLRRLPNPIIPVTGWPAFWQLDRLGQMASHHASYHALREFDQRVGPDAVVAVALRGDSFEYPLFSAGARRWLQPVTERLPADTWSGHANWLLYDGRLNIEPLQGDIELGNNYWLRPLLPEKAVDARAETPP